MQINIPALILLASMLAPGGAALAADEGVVRTDTAVLKASDALTKIEAETLVLKARDRQLAVQMSIMAKQNEMAAKQGENDKRERASVGANPIVHSVEGIGENKFATLELDNGNLIDVRAGDRLANGMKIISIDPNVVMVEGANKKRLRLSSADLSPAPFNPSFPSAGVSLPKLFPGATNGASK